MQKRKTGQTNLKITRLKRKHGKGEISCVVSPRWLKFHFETVKPFKSNELVMVDVMTIDKSNKNKLICKLFVTRNDLLKVTNCLRVDMMTCA